MYNHFMFAKPIVEAQNKVDSHEVLTLTRCCHIERKDIAALSRMKLNTSGIITNTRATENTVHDDSAFGT